MSRTRLRHASVRLVSDLLPRALGRLGIHIPPPRGRLRPRDQDYCMEVPFRYAVPAPADRLPIGVVCHLFHPDLAAWLFGVIGRIECPADLYVSTDTAAKKAAIESIFGGWGRGRVDIRIVPNRGRDIAPKLVTFADVYDRHDIVLFLHSKKSPHLAFGDRWRDHLIRCIVGSPETVSSVMETFNRRPDVGMIIPQHFPPMRQRDWINWANNFLRSRRLAWRMGFDLSADHYMDLPAGSMFWTRSAALRPILDMKLSLDDFHMERGQIDMTTAHCVERLFLYSCEKAGFTWVKVADREAMEPEDAIVSITQATDIDDFLAEYRFDLLVMEGLRS